MECKNCKYFQKDSDSVIFGACNISNMCDTKSCGIVSDEDVKNMRICYNCEYWLGGGDWGLSCRKDYYNCNCNGFAEACEQFKLRY